MYRLTHKKKSGCFYVAHHLTFKLKMNRKRRDKRTIDHFTSIKWQLVPRKRERERKKSNNASNLNIIDHTVVCGNIGISDCITFKREYRQNFSKKLREKYACEKKLKSRQKYKNVDNSQVDRLKSRLQLISLDG